MRLQIQRGQNGFNTQVGIRPHHAQAVFGDGFAKLGQVRVWANMGRHVVTRNDRNPDLQAHALRQCQRRQASTARVGDTHVGDEGRAVGNAGGQHGTQALFDQQVVAFGGVSQTLQVAIRQGALGQALKG